MTARGGLDLACVTLGVIGAVVPLDFFFALGFGYAVTSAAFACGVPRRFAPAVVAFAVFATVLLGKLLR